MMSANFKSCRQYLTLSSSLSSLKSEFLKHKMRLSVIEPSRRLNVLSTAMKREALVKLDYDLLNATFQIATCKKPRPFTKSSCFVAAPVVRLAFYKPRNGLGLIYRNPGEGVELCFRRVERGRIWLRSRDSFPDAEPTSILQ